MQPLIPLTINSPGTKGLNSQQSATNIDIGWATQLDNCVYDLAGRITARKGWTKLTTSGSPGVFDIEAIHCYETSSATSVVSASNLKIFSGTTALTDRTGTITAPTANKWKLVTYNSQFILGFQAAHAPIAATGIAAFTNLSAVAGYTAPSTGDLNGGVALSAFGRAWATDTDGQTLHYSGSALNYMKWADADGGGKIQTQAYWPNGSDFITGLAAWEDKLIVFGKNATLVYASPQIPASIALFDTIKGVGCSARDSVCEVGTDVFFLSETGVRSLKRTFLTTKAPIQDISNNVRDLFLIYAAGQAPKVRSVYNQKEGLYILLFPQTSTTDIFCFDIKKLQQDQAANSSQNVRVSQWNGFGRCACLAYGRDEIMYGGFRDNVNSPNGVIGSYSGYLDNTLTYTGTYKSPWIDLSNDQQAGTFIKIPKESKITTAGGSSYALTAYWAYDFSTSLHTLNKSVMSGGSTMEWGLFEWGIAEWGGSTKALSNTKFPLSGTGQFIQFGISWVINGYEITIQKIDLFIKKGRLSR